jgi:demethylmenaquinone methyltransferase/2-methoxy-6-polyprenyl-1,4-benzoquinol methylase
MKKTPLRQAIATPATKRPYTRQVFATIADRYDLVTVLLSFNRDQAWKRRMVKQIGVKPGDAALDLACGTGDISFPLAREGARVVGLDITERMLRIARAKAVSAGRSVPGGAAAPCASGADASGEGHRAEVQFVLGDMMALPFPDRSFDVVTTGYGIRNVPDIAGALAEIHRALKPGGRLFSLDFNRPPNVLVRRAYLAYLTLAGSALGWVLHRDPDMYRYIPETIRLHPGASTLVEMMEAAGFDTVTYRPVFGGFMALHAGVRGERGRPGG